MAKQVLSDLNLNQNEIQNAVEHNLALAPSAPVEGQHYWNTANKTWLIYNGTSWVDATSQGKVYTFQNGVKELTGDDAGKVELNLASGANAGNVTLSQNANGLKAQVAEASTSAKGIIEIATDAEVETGTSEVLAVNPKQLAGKVDKLATKPTAGTYTKLTINAEGQVTAGTTLSASDIPDLTLAKITDVTASKDEVNILDGATITTAELNILDGVTATATEINVLDGITASTAELNIMDGVTVTASDINSITSKIALTDLSIASGSADYLGYDNTSGQISAKVDTTVTESSSKLITSGAVATAIANAVASVIIPKASVANVSGLGSLTKSHVGWMYNMSAEFTTTADFVEGAGITYPAGTNVVIVEYTSGTYKYDVFAGFVDTSSFITASSTDTLTNKTIDADDNTISNLTTSNLKSGVLQTTVRAVASASDSALASEKAIATAIKDFITASSTNTLTNKTFDANGTGNSISNIETADFASGVLQTSVRATSSASDSALASEKAIATALAGKTGKLTATNPALTPSSGVATWTISNTLGDADVNVMIKEVSSGDEVICEVSCSASNIVVKMNASANITAGTYKAVIIG